MPCVGGVGWWDPDGAQVWWCIDSGAGSWCSAVVVVVVAVVVGGGQLVSYNQTLALLTALYTALHTTDRSGESRWAFKLL